MKKKLDKPTQEVFDALMEITDKQPKSAFGILGIFLKHCSGNVKSIKLVKEVKVPIVPISNN